MHIHLNPLGGLAGDMFCAALLDACPDLLPLVQETVASLGLPVGVEIGLRSAAGPIKGKHLSATTQQEPHPHRAFRDILALLEQAPLADGVRKRTVRIFTLLAAAEGRVHGVEPAAVSFHEVGSWDSIADIVCAAALLQALEVDTASCTPLPLGRGRVQSAHGLLPLPAPATSLLLEGLPVTDDGIEGERVTPTGAAILRSLDPNASAPPHGVLRGSGMGFGTRTLAGGVPNCLQILCIEAIPQTTPNHFRSDHVTTLRFEVDDQTPEDFALALEHIRQSAGVLSVTCLQGIGKGGRPTMSVEVLVRPEHSQQAAEACFRETTTIGLRMQEVSRLTLPRSRQQVQVDESELEVKRVQRPGGATAKAEIRDVAEVASQAERSRLRHSAEARAMARDKDDE